MNKVEFIKELKEIGFQKFKDCDIYHLGHNRLWFEDKKICFSNRQGEKNSVVIILGYNKKEKALELIRCVCIVKLG